MQKSLQITLLGNPILRKTASSVKNIQDKDIQKLIDKMLVKVMEVNGVGMAAPQVGQSLQIFIMASHPNPRYPKAPLMEPMAIINPKIIKLSKEKAKDWEGCLSVPSLRGFLPRSTRVSVTFYNRKGRKENKVYEDFLARIFQHEFDHLQGKLFIDRVESTLDLMNEEEWKKLFKT